MDIELYQSAKSQSEICGVFSNPKRIMIIWTLNESEKSVGELANLINSSLQSTSQHLKIMKNKNILNTRRDAQTIYYSINEEMIGEICTVLSNCPS